MNFDAESTYPLNIFAKSNFPCTWNTIKVGWDLKRLVPEEIGKFAVNYLENNSQLVNAYISEVIMGVEHYDMDFYLKNIFETLNLEIIEKGSPLWNKEWRKWRYAIMCEMYNNIKNDEELLEKIEGVYADFGYPEDMKHLIYYMPSEDKLPESTTVTEAREQLIQKIAVFLEEERDIS